MIHTEHRHRGSDDLVIDLNREITRGAESPDSFSTLSSNELAALLREASTRDLDDILNRGAVHVDYDRQRIHRDSFWKGSFAKDSLLGWEERLRNKLFGNGRTASEFTGGSFWKRFDRIEDGVAHGYVVNYELGALPGLPEVRRVIYPDDKREYFRKGDPILLLTYTNAPYKAVYDTIKIIGESNAIGVMHVGDFPNGVEIAKFVMARHNYPFDNMSVEDHQTIFKAADKTAPTAEALGGVWQGRLVFVPTTRDSIANQFNPILFRSELVAKDGGVQFRCVAGTGPSEHLCREGELRQVAPGLLLARWKAPETQEGLLALLGKTGERASDELELRLILRRL